MTKSSLTRFECVMCEKPHVKEEYLDPKRKGQSRFHGLVTRLVERNMLDSNWGFFTKRQQDAIVNAFLARNDLSGSWLPEWVAVDARLRQGMTLPASTHAAQAMRVLALNAARDKEEGR